MIQPTKSQMGILSQVPDVLVLMGNENGAGMFLEADMERMRRHITTILRDRPDLRRLFEQCAEEASGIIRVPTIKLEPK